MWSAVNWLSQKAGINLDDANEVLNCSDSFNSNTQQSSDLEDQANEFGKENQASASNGSFSTPTGSKRSRRSSRWVSGTNGNTSANNNSSSQLASASPPITTIIMPNGSSGGSGTFRSSNGNGQLSHPTMPPIMVPTGPRNASAGYSSLTGLVSSSVSPIGMHSKTSSPTSFSAWKDVSMAADVNSPGFAFRIVRQAEKQAELGSRNYPTVQEKYLHAKYLPNIKLRGSPKPVVTPHKPRSVPLLPLAAPSPPSSEGSPLAPMLPGSTSPSTAGLFPPPLSTTSMPDFRSTDYYASPAMRSSDGSAGRLLPSMHLNTSSSSALSGAATSVGLAASMTGPDYSSLAVAGSAVPVSAGLGRPSPNLSIGETHINGSDDLDQLLGDSQEQEDPTSLQAVLAALGKSQSGKGVKRGRMAEYEDPGNKRQCSDALPQTLNSISQPSVGDHSSANNGIVAGVPSSSNSSGGGEKRALDTSTGSSTSLNSSGHGSPCAKLPRTSPGDTLLAQASLYEDAPSSTPALQPGNTSSSLASLRTRYTLARQRIAAASGGTRAVPEVTTTIATDTSPNTKVSSSPSGVKSTRLFSSLNQTVGLGGTSGESSDAVPDEECPKKKKRCVNPWFASMSSSRKMLSQEQMSPKMESELDAQHDSDDSDDKSSDDSDHLSEHSMVVNGGGDSEAPADGGEGETAVQRSSASPAARAVPSTSADSSPGGATPRLVSLSAHHTDKKATNTRLKKMMGLLFNLTDEEIELSETPPVPAASSSTSALSATRNTSASITPSQSVPSFFNAASASNTASTASESIPSFTFNLKPSTSSSSNAPLTASSGSEVAVSATFTLPTTAPKTGFAGVLASAVASISSGEGRDTTAQSGDSTPPSDLSRAATLPVSSLAAGSSSVSASFTLPLPNRAITVPTSDVPTSSGATTTAALPSYFEAKKTSDAIASTTNTNASNEKTTTPFSSGAPMFNFGASPAPTSLSSISANPLLVNSSSPNDGKSASGGFFTSGVSALPTASLSTTIGSSTSTASLAAPAAASANLFSFAVSAASGANPTDGGTAAANTSPTATSTAASAPPPLFSFGSAPTSIAGNSFSATSAPGAGTGAFGGDSSKPAAETSVASAVKPSGFTFGNTSALSTGFADSSKGAQGQTQPAKPASGFSFGATPAANVADSNQGPSAAKSLFSFGSSASSTAANPLLNTSTSNAQGGDSVAPAPAFSFGSKPAAAPAAPATTSAAPSAGMFSFGANPSTAPSSTAAAASFTFGPGATGAKASFGTSSTSASFTFTPKATNEKSDVGNASGSTTSAASSPFLFGGGAAATSSNAATATSTAASQAPSPFTFGSAATAVSNTANTSTAAPLAGSSLFSFGSSATNASAPPAFGSAPATTASAIFGAMPSSATTANNPPPPSFGSSVNSNPPAFGATAASTTTNTFGSFSTSGNNPFTGAAAAAASTPNANASFSFGASATAKPSKSVTFGASTVMSGTSANLFGQAASQPQAAATGTNLFGQINATSATSATSNNLFGQTPSAATPQFGSGTFGQASAASAGQTSQSSSTAASGVSPFQFGATAAAGGSATAGSSGFSFGSAPSAGGTGGAPVFGATPVPSFGSTAQSSNPPPAFGSAATSNPPAFGATASSTGVPSFGAAPSAATPSFGAPVAGAMPSFGGPTSPGSGMFQFSSGNPGTPQQQQQQANAFNAGGNNASAASRRPRVRAHRRNR